ncbi:CvpA family protein [bacterium]|nr:CvpA family protein [bacterium]
MYLDIILLLLLVLCMTVGVLKGVLTPLITFFSLFLSVVLVVFFLDPCLMGLRELTHPWEGNFLVTLLTSKFVAGLLLILILFFVIASLAEFIKRKLMNALDLKFSDRFLGLFCGAAVGVFLCVMLCIGLIWSRTLVVSQANGEGLSKYDAILQSSQGYSVSLAVIDWTKSKFPKFSSLLPDEKSEQR